MLIGDIYDAALDRALWGNVLEQTCQFVNGYNAGLLAHDLVQDKGHLHVQWGADPRYVELYEKVYAKLNPMNVPSLLYAEAGAVLASASWQCLGLEGVLLSARGRSILGLGLEGVLLSARGRSILGWVRHFCRPARHRHQVQIEHPSLSARQCWLLLRGVMQSPGRRSRPTWPDFVRCLRLSRRPS